MSNLTVEIPRPSEENKLLLTNTFIPVEENSHSSSIKNAAIKALIAPIQAVHEYDRDIRNEINSAPNQDLIHANKVALTRTIEIISDREEEPILKRAVACCSIPTIGGSCLAGSLVSTALIIGAIALTLLTAVVGVGVLVSIFTGSADDSSYVPYQ